MSIIIGLGNKARHGKDTVCKHYIDTYGSELDIRRYAFGDTLKTEFYQLLLDPLAPFWNVTPRGWPGYLELPHPRVVFVSEQEKIEWVNTHKRVLGPFLQFYGTEYIRGINPFYWVNKVWAKIRADKPVIAVIPDMRFMNEFLFVKANNGFTVRCVREGFVDPTRDPNHPSETELDRAAWDFVITAQDGDVATLLSDADSVFTMIQERVTPTIPEADGVISKAA